MHNKEASRMTRMFLWFRGHKFKENILFFSSLASSTFEVDEGTSRQVNEGTSRQVDEGLRNACMQQGFLAKWLTHSRNDYAQLLIRVFRA